MLSHLVALTVRRLLRPVHQNFDLHVWGVLVGIQTNEKKKLDSHFGAVVSYRLSLCFRRLLVESYFNKDFSWP